MQTALALDPSRCSIVQAADVHPARRSACPECGDQHMGATSLYRTPLGLFCSETHATAYVDTKNSATRRELAQGPVSTHCVVAFNRVGESRIYATAQTPAGADTIAEGCVGRWLRAFGKVARTKVVCISTPVYRAADYDMTPNERAEVLALAGGKDWA